jgi:DNA-binding NarL/FixJ family response regulator
MNATVRILIADDHDTVRTGLHALLEAVPEWTVCAETGDGRVAVDLAREHEPHIAVVDLTMPGLNGLDATRQIRKAHPECEVLILTMHRSEQLIHEILNAGAIGYVLKSDAAEKIVEAIRHLLDHRPYFTSIGSHVLPDTYLQPAHTAMPSAPRELTPREREVVQLIAEGNSSKEIAVRLGISEKTTETHRANLMRKLNIHSVSEIVRYAIRNRMIEP